MSIEIIDELAIEIAVKPARTPVLAGAERDVPSMATQSHWTRIIISENFSSVR